MMDEQHIEMTHQKKKIFGVFIVILSVFILFLIVSTGVDISNKIKQGKYIGQEVEARNSITIVDSGEIYSKPDLGIISFSVVNEAKTSYNAMSKNTEVMNKVIEAMKGQGIEEKDLKTAYYNINPLYEYRGATYYNSGERVLTGYEVTQSLQVKIRDLDKVGAIIEAAAAAGSNQIGSLALTIDNEDELKEQARTQAIDKAKEKAEKLASQLGVRLGKIISFSENNYYPYYTDSLSLEKGMGGAAAVPDIQTGENKVSISVSVTYEIY